MSAYHQAVIIGSGFGGLLAALNLRKQGIQDFIILERRAFLGGTWLQNSYPGAAVDVQSPLYSLCDEPYDWSQMFAEQKELSEYTNYVIAKHELNKCAFTDCEVKKIAWHEREQKWYIDVAGRAPIQAQFVINATGPLSTPVTPNFTGKDSFKGASFHSNNWDHSFDYKNKRVAVIGSGASAAQVIPAIAPDVRHLHVFQRTPHWVMPRPDYVFKNWQRKILRSKWAYHFLRILIYWALEIRVIGFKYSRTLLDLLATRKATAFLKKAIPDDDLREQLTPEFVIGCKRILLSSTLYPAYCRDNVTLHDKTEGIDEITETGIRTQQGSEYELDLIVYATGFDATDSVISYPVIGRDGKRLSTFWQDYPRAYLGTTVPGFPNLFVVTGPNTGIGHTSALFVIESQMKYIMACIWRVQANQYQAIEVKPEAEEQYTRLIHKEMAKTVWHTGGCDSWYKSKSGKVIAMFPGFSFTFRRWASNFKHADHHFYGSK
ncbi:MAG: flavin-containing monooxygenase [Aestuariibacter sp.]